MAAAMLLALAVAASSLRQPALHVRMAPFAAAAPPPGSLALSVQRLALSDAARCLEECRTPPHEGAMSLMDRLEHAHCRAVAWAVSRERLVRWGFGKWLESQALALRAAVPQPLVSPLLPHVHPSDDLTLRSALAPIRVRRLTAAAFTVSPVAVCRLAWSLCLLWAVRALLPQALAVRQQRRLVEPLLDQIASAYELLR